MRKGVLSDKTIMRECRPMYMVGRKPINEKAPHRKSKEVEPVNAKQRGQHHDRVVQRDKPKPAHKPAHSLKPMDLEQRLVNPTKSFYYHDQKRKSRPRYEMLSDLFWDREMYEAKEQRRKALETEERQKSYREVPITLHPVY